MLMPAQLFGASVGSAARLQSNGAVDNSAQGRRRSTSAAIKSSSLRAGFKAVHVSKVATREVSPRTCNNVWREQRLA